MSAPVATLGSPTTSAAERDGSDEAASTLRSSALVPMLKVSELDAVVAAVSSEHAMVAVTLTEAASISIVTSSSCTPAELATMLRRAPCADALKSLTVPERTNDVTTEGEEGGNDVVVAGGGEGG